MKQLIFILLLSLSTNAQNFEWVRTFGNLQDNYAESIALDAAGNVYTTGLLGLTTDFDPGLGTYNLSTNGGSDVFVQKMDANGNFIWARSFGGTSSDQGNASIIDPSGNVYTTGFFTGTADFDPGAGTYYLTSAMGIFNSPSQDVFIHKMDANGNFLWAKSFGGPAYDDALSIVVDDAGFVYVTGKYADTVDFDPGAGVYNLISAGPQSDIYVLKLDTNGNFIWARAFDGSTGNDTGRSVDVDSAGNVYTTGDFQGTVDFDPGTGTSIYSPVGVGDAFVQKMNATGDFIWVKTFGGATSDVAESVSVSPTGNVYITGRFEQTVDFDPGAGIYNLTSNGGLDIFTCKLNTSGNLIWAKSFGGTGHDWGQANAIDTDESVYITGLFYWTVDFDPGAGAYNLTSNGVNDVFISKLDSAGNFNWSGSFGGTGNEWSWSVAVDDISNVYTTGYFEATVDFDTGTGVDNITSNGNYDIFVHRLNQCVGGTGTQVVTACDSYTWIDGNTYTSSTNTPTWSYSFATGCDSIVTLDLTIANSTTGTDVQSACDSYTWIDENTYTSSNNSASWILTNMQGCDSIVTLDLTIIPLPDTSVLASGSSLTADINANSYQWLNCDDNYSILPGETNQSFFPQSVGNYAVEITLNGCTDTSSCYYFDDAGIAEEGINNHPIRIKVVDLLGRETPERPNTTLIYIYSDGTTEKIYRME